MRLREAEDGGTVNEYRVLDREGLLAYRARVARASVSSSMMRHWAAGDEEEGSGELWLSEDELRGYSGGKKLFQVPAACPCVPPCDMPRPPRMAMHVYSLRRC